MRTQNAEPTTHNHDETEPSPSRGCPRSAFRVRRSAFRPAFTLTEVLVVIGLIVLLILLAVPAFNIINGTRSVAAGEDLVAAMLGRARAEAVKNRRSTSVAFFKDPAVDRYVMAISVEASQTGQLLPEPAGLDNYKSWSQFQETSTAGTPVPTAYQPGHTVIAMVLVNDEGMSKPVTKKFVCIETHTANLTNRPPNPAFWDDLEEDAVNVLQGFEFQYLPKGVGVQLVHDGKAAGADRFVSAGVITFDERGQLVHEPFRWEDDASMQGELADLSEREVPNAAGDFYTQLGVVVFDDELFKSANGSDAYQQDYFDGATNPQEGAEEVWLDDNGVVLMVNRYNGTLVRSE